MFVGGIEENDQIPVVVPVALEQKDETNEQQEVTVTESGGDKVTGSIKQNVISWLSSSGYDCQDVTIKQFMTDCPYKASQSTMARILKEIKSKPE